MAIDLNLWRFKGVRDRDCGVVMSEDERWDRAMVIETRPAPERGPFGIGLGAKLSGGYPDPSWGAVPVGPMAPALPRPVSGGLVGVPGGGTYARASVSNGPPRGCLPVTLRP